MKAIVIVRHGHCERLSGKLSATGKAGSRKVAERIKSEIGKSSVKVFSAPTKPAEGTADIIADVCNADLRICDQLFCSHIDELRRYLEQHENDANVLVLVTQMEQVIGLQAVIAEWKNYKTLDYQPILPAHARLIHLNDGKVVNLN